MTSVPDPFPAAVARLITPDDPQPQPSAPRPLPTRGEFASMGVFDRFRRALANITGTAK